MRKQPEVTERTRAALADAFWELYAGEGLPVERIAVRAITERAGYNRATFYLHYRDVYDLLAQIEDALLDSARGVIEGRLLAGGDLDLAAHMGLIAELARANRERLAVLLRRDPEFLARFKDVVRPLVERFLVTDPSLDAERRGLVCELYLAGLLGVIVRWLSECPDMPIEELISLVAGELLGRGRDAAMVDVRPT